MRQSLVSDAQQPTRSENSEQCMPIAALLRRNEVLTAKDDVHHLHRAELKDLSMQHQHQLACFLNSPRRFGAFFPETGFFAGMRAVVRPYGPS